MNGAGLEIPLTTNYMNIEIKYTIKLNDNTEIVINEVEARELFRRLKAHFEPNTTFIGGGTITNPVIGPNATPWYTSCGSNVNGCY